MTVPKLVDDDCRFCTWAATFAVRRSDVQPVRLSRVVEGESRLGEDERARLPDGYEECVQLVTEDAVYSCGAAVERSFALAGVLPERVVDFLEQFEDYERLREAVYHLLTDNRDIVANVLGREPPVSDHVSAESVHPERTSRDG